MNRTRFSLTVIAAVLAAAFLALGAASASAATPNPDHVSFTHEGCRLLTTTTLPNADGDFICSDAEYTTGNLGKNWNELDNVPFRLTADNGGGDQTYAVAITADAMNAGHPGYDVVSVPVLNKRLSTGGTANAANNCSLSASPTAAANPNGGTLSPGVGGTDQSLYRVLTITQKAGATCVFDWYARLALGSHLYPGSSLHTNLTNQTFGTSGIGAKDVSIPVKEIAPQTVSKTMNANRGSSYTWTVSKTAAPADGIDFSNSCDPQARSYSPVTITISWTRSAPGPDGSTQYTTVIKATNPAHRIVDVKVTDDIFLGTTKGNQSPVDTGTQDFTSVPANTTNFVLFTHTGTLTAQQVGNATSLNDVATAQYRDHAYPDIAIPGNTTATASTGISLNSGSNPSATVTDVETMVGDSHLSFAVTQDPQFSGTGGSLATSGFTYDPGDGTTTYTPGSNAPHITGPLTWNGTISVPSSNTGSFSGSVTFTKAVYLDQPENITSSHLDDDVVINDGSIDPSTAFGDWPASMRDSRSIPITAQACVTGLKFNDQNANGTQDDGEGGLSGWTFYVDYNDNGVLDNGEPSGTSGNDGTFSINGIDPGQWKVREVGQTGWVCSKPATADAHGCYYTIDTSDGTTATTGLDFGNYQPTPDLHLTKAVDITTAHDGDALTYTIRLTNTGTGAALNVAVGDLIAGTDHSCGTLVLKSGSDADKRLDPGEVWEYTCSYQAAHADEDSNHVITNTATVKDATDQFGNDLPTLTASAQTLIIHPAILITKQGPVSADAGARLDYLLTVTNPGDTPLSAVGVSDPKCDAAPVTLVSKNGDATPDTLDPGDTWTFSCSANSPSNQPAFQNVASAAGNDPLGRVVNSSAPFLTQLVLAETPQSVTRGKAILNGPTGCVAKTFNARVRGTQIASVVFVLDGKVIKRVTNSKGASTIVARVNPAKLRLGVHRLVVNITFTSGSQTSPITRRLSFQRCAKKLRQPRFTG